MEFCLLVASVIMGILTASEGCSHPIGGAPIDETSIDDKVKGSDVVVQGVVLSSERDRGRLDGELYSVEVEVRCVYKGDPVDRIIHIDEVGHIAGLCWATNLTFGQEYLVYLYRSNQGRYRPSYVQDPAIQGYLDEVDFCNTRVTYPTGHNQDTTGYECTNPLTKDECEPNSVAAENVPADTENPAVQVTTGSQVSSQILQQSTNLETKTRSTGAPGSTQPNFGTRKESGGSQDKVPADKSVVASSSKEDNGNNASTALTWHLITLLLASSIFLL